MGKRRPVKIADGEEEARFELLRRIEILQNDLTSIANDIKFDNGGEKLIIATDTTVQRSQGYACEFIGYLYRLREAETPRRRRLFSRNRR